MTCKSPYKGNNAVGKARGRRIVGPIRPTLVSHPQADFACHARRGQRFRSPPQTTPLAISTSISPSEYPNSDSSSEACWLNFGGTCRTLGLLRERRIGEATPLYQSFATTSPRWTACALVRAWSID